MKKIMILAGPSASGKTTVMMNMLKKRPRFEYIRSATTRAPRGDGHDSEYIYLSVEEFTSRIENDGMLEHTNFGGNLYGTPASEIERIFGEGNIPVLVLDINGVVSLKSKKRDFDVFAVYILTDMDVLDARLYERAVADGMTEKAVQTLEKRKAQNRADIERVRQLGDVFDLVISNDVVEETANAILKEFEK
ncbi:MAG: hypothetical protein J6V09_07655 [Clostridia bacterium]|nr:hypothetical protein [Clostridia bacterium]